MVQENSDDDHILTLKNLNPAVKNVEYSVGYSNISIRASQLENELKNGVIKPFDSVIHANHGDCHENGQKPITYLRQIMALCTYPELISNDLFPNDVKDKAKSFLSACAGNSIGSYTDSAGLEKIRIAISEFISARDGGIPCDPDNIFMTTGASSGIKLMTKLFLSSRYCKKLAGFMIPIPQYPLYSATIVEYNGHKIGYYLDEDNNWALSVKELERAYNESLSLCEPRVICIINPGNPTGQVLSLSNMKEIIKWAYEKKLFIFADEVYQDNVYADEVRFHSFKKVAYKMGYPYSNMEIVSFYSASKGYMGECGTRAGYFEVINMDPDVKVELRKLSTAQLCSNAIGQICLGAVVCPPKIGEPSYELFIREKTRVLSELKEKARMVSESFNKIEDVTCQIVQGAMYAFPRIKIPQKAIEHAKSLNMEPDMFYCVELVEKTGICVVPGCGFLQQPGTFHFRTTILPPVEHIKTLLERFEKFHLGFLKEWN